MDSNRIKNLATGVRDALRAEASARLDAVLAEGSRERLEAAEQVRSIETDIREHGRDEVVDRAAYTWFNRLCALRFMDANGYTPTPVVTPREGSTQPAILADAAQGVFDPEYEVSADVKQRVVALLSGLIPSTNAAEDAYALLLWAVCSKYAGSMGYLFAENVTSSLLMPQDLLAQGSILSRIVEDMDREACSDVEVLGWLYQFYIAERKDQVFAAYKKGKKAQAADIAPATQLFTPDWIVRYMTENSLGRLWMLNNPDSELAESMDYYIAPEESEPYIEVSSAEDIRVLDPACGSGHILVYAFDLLFRMYEEEGWPTEDIPEMILSNNLFGLEIDRRAAEIASFALEMKARERDPRFFDRNVDARIKVLDPVELSSQELELVPQLAKRRGLLDAMSHLDEVGSLYMPDGLDEFVLTNVLERVAHDGSLFAESALSKLKTMLANVRALSQSYHCVIANPPYMGSGNMNPWLSAWVKVSYQNEKSDLCACFINRGLTFTKKQGYSSIITSDTCMYLSSFEGLRKKLLENAAIIALIDTRGSNAHPDVFDANAGWTFQKEKGHQRQGSYFKLDQPIGEKQSALIEAVHDHDCGWRYSVDADFFKAIPGWPIAYWISEATQQSFISFESIGSLFPSSVGIQTGDNKRFIHYWWEVEYVGIAFGCHSIEGAIRTGLRWFPYNKGGEYRKWFGNDYEVLNWKNDGEEVKTLAPGEKRHVQDCRAMFKFAPVVTWSRITSGTPAFRLKGDGFLSDMAGFGFYPPHDESLLLLALCNSSVSQTFLKFLSPTMNCMIGDVSKIPYARANGEVNKLATDCIALVRADWDSFEFSWGFSRHPMVCVNVERSIRIADAYSRWEAECRERFDRLKANEEELNRIFARIYHMEGEVPIEVPDDKVSVRLADRSRDARSLISYGIGCMLGRYSTEVEGLVLADQGSTLDDFRAKVVDAKYLPDEDNVLPVLSDEWFDDDIVSGFRIWLAHAFSPQTVDENVVWLEESIGKDLRTYFCKDFYSDHLKTYQKRPIYWMFQSPKRSFQCLVYMHRYNEGTVGTVLTYIRSLEDKLQARLSSLQSKDASAADLKAADKVRASIAELADWERNVVKPLADDRISIDLDDGVKVNYNKFPRALAKVPGLSEWK